MKSAGSEVPRTHDEYLARVPRGMRTALEDLRRTIHAAAPEADEVISYQMPAFRQDGMLVCYAAFTDHCSLFAGADVRQKFARELKRYGGGKGTIQFTPEEPLPASLVTRIVRFRVAENETRAAAKRTKRSKKIR